MKKYVQLDLHLICNFNLELYSQLGLSELDLFLAKIFFQTFTVGTTYSRSELRVGVFICPVVIYYLTFQFILINSFV